MTSLCLGTRLRCDQSSRLRLVLVVCTRHTLSFDTICPFANREECARHLIMTISAAVECCCWRMPCAAWALLSLDRVRVDSRTMDWTHAGQLLAEEGSGGIGPRSPRILRVNRSSRTIHIGKDRRAAPEVEWLDTEPALRSSSASSNRSSSGKNLDRVGLQHRHSVSSRQLQAQLAFLHGVVRQFRERWGDGAASLSVLLGVLLQELGTHDQITAHRLHIVRALHRCITEFGPSLIWPTLTALARPNAEDERDTVVSNDNANAEQQAIGRLGSDCNVSTHDGSVTTCEYGTNASAATTRQQQQQEQHEEVEETPGDGKWPIAAMRTLLRTSFNDDLAVALSHLVQRWLDACGPHEDRPQLVSTLQEMREHLGALLLEQHDTSVHYNLEHSKPVSGRWLVVSGRAEPHDRVSVRMVEAKLASGSPQAASSTISSSRGGDGAVQLVRFAVLTSGTCSTTAGSGDTRLLTPYLPKARPIAESQSWTGWDATVTLHLVQRLVYEGVGLLFCETELPPLLLSVAAQHHIACTVGLDEEESILLQRRYNLVPFADLDDLRHGLRRAEGALRVRSSKFGAAVGLRRVRFSGRSVWELGHVFPESRAVVPQQAAQVKHTGPSLPVVQLVLCGGSPAVLSQYRIAVRRCLACLLALYLPSEPHVTSDAPPSTAKSCSSVPFCAIVPGAGAPFAAVATALLRRANECDREGAKNLTGKSTAFATATVLRAIAKALRAANCALFRNASRSDVLAALAAHSNIESRADEHSQPSDKCSGGVNLPDTRLAAELCAVYERQQQQQKQQQQCQQQQVPYVNGMPSDVSLAAPELPASLRSHCPGVGIVYHPPTGQDASCVPPWRFQDPLRACIVHPTSTVYAMIETAIVAAAQTLRVADMLFC